MRYEIEVKRYSQLRETGASIVIGDGRVFVDNELIAHISNARTGVFKGIAYPDYLQRPGIQLGR